MLPKTDQRIAHLKSIDFVNDVAFRAGTPVVMDRFGKVDVPENILTNKLGSMYRLEPKDIADLWILCKNLSFDWRAAR